MYNHLMIKLIIKENEKDQRLDKFLKKYLKNAPLSHIYKLIRKDVKINGKRAKIETFLNVGDELNLYISDDELAKLTENKKNIKTKKQFNIAYEDENILIAEKPLGLLTHGDATEKKNHLANQVISYLIEKGDYSPNLERTFSPAPVNRLDRNTTGLVMFGKTSKSVQVLNKMLKEKNCIDKYYLTIVGGNLKEEIVLRDKMVKSEKKNMITVLNSDSDEGKDMETIVKPIMYRDGFTLVEVNLITGRTHQIRAHLAQAGFPIIGDTKYGNRALNQKISQKFDLSTQFLHAYKLSFMKCEEPLHYLERKKIIAKLPKKFLEIAENIFGDIDNDTVY